MIDTIHRKKTVDVLINAKEQNLKAIKIRSRKRNRQSNRKYKKRDSTSRLREKRQFFKANGMNKDGYVLRGTSVMQELKMSVGHPFFHGIPHCSIQKFSIHLVEQLQALTDLLMGKYKRFGKTHSSNANKGLQVGLSITAGGISKHYSELHGKDPPYAGTVQISSAAYKHVVCRQIWIVIRAILQEGKHKVQSVMSLVHFLDLGISNELIAFGHLAWYKRALAICEKLNRETKEMRTLPNMPVSGIWICNHSSTPHYDRHDGGPAFVIGLNDLSFEMVDQKLNYRKHCLHPGEALGGSWSWRAHSGKSLFFDSLIL